MHRNVVLVPACSQFVMSGLPVGGSNRHGDQEPRAEQSSGRAQQAV